METPHKILILDDDADWLELCREIFAQLPSKPEIRTATSSSRALGMLDSEPFRLLICDLKMPRMDGLQVLSVVRRRFPGLRTIVLSGLEDEEFRSRAYALGVDLFWLKSDMQQDSKMFLDCLESLLGRDSDGGFRGIQSKGLMDIIQMECLSRSSTVLRITRGPLVAKLWFQEGELLDAVSELNNMISGNLFSLLNKKGQYSLTRAKTELISGEEKRKRSPDSGLKINFNADGQKVELKLLIPQAE